MRLAGVGLIASVCLASLAACSSDDPAATPATDAGTDAPVSNGPTEAGVTPTNDGGSDAGRPPPPAGCVEDADSKATEAEPCVSDSFAIFVDGAAGSDTATGTKAQPMKTIGAALNGAKATNRRRVYICGSGPFAEKLAPDFGVAIIGGFSCGSWKYDGTRVRVAPTQPGPVVKLTSVSGISLSDVELVPLDTHALNDGSSSIGVLLNKTDVHLTRVVVTAAAGAAGQPGGAGATGTFKTSSTETGAAVAISPGVCTCISGETTIGGYGENFANSGSAAQQGQPIYPTGVEQHGAPGSGPSGGKAGDTGEGGKHAASQPLLGYLDETGWRPASGIDGSTIGHVGQGGGGGGCGTSPASTCIMNGLRGGAGGCGGCGGSPGKGGAGGGASVAVIAIDTVLWAEACTFTAGAGGAGGSGGSGGNGGPGGAGGIMQTAGGAGGAGGNGGPGSGGAGGLSIAVLYRGATPKLDDDTKGQLANGAAGKGGGPGSQFGDNVGLPGKAGKVVDASML